MCACACDNLQPFAYRLPRQPNWTDVEIDPSFWSLAIWWRLPFERPSQCDNTKKKQANKKRIKIINKTISSSIAANDRAAPSHTCASLPACGCADPSRVFEFGPDFWPMVCCMAAFMLCIMPPCEPLCELPPLPLSLSELLAFASSFSFFLASDLERGRNTSKIVGRRFGLAVPGNRHKSINRYDKQIEYSRISYYYLSLFLWFCLFLLSFICVDGWSLGIVKRRPNIAGDLTDTSIMLSIVFEMTNSYYFSFPGHQLQRDICEIAICFVILSQLARLTFTDRNGKLMTRERNNFGSRLCIVFNCFCCCCWCCRYFLFVIY